MFLAGQALTTFGHHQQSTNLLSTDQTEPEATGCQPRGPETTGKRLYRVPELQRVVAALKANGPLLIVGAEGCGKTFLMDAVIEQLSTEGYTVAALEPATPKHMLMAIASELGVPTQNLEGKAISVDELKILISQHLSQNTAFILIDNAQKCDAKVRDWLKALKRQGVPLLLTATNPPRSDIFLHLPRLELAPLPEYAIRELMEQEALEKGMNLKPRELARLQERTGGNPMLAKRVIEEEYLGLDIEAGDHHRYFDLTPLILLVAVVLMVMRFFTMGLNNPSLYIMTAMFGSFMMGISRVLYKLPKESQRIKT